MNDLPDFAVTRTSARSHALVSDASLAHVCNDAIAEASRDHHAISAVPSREWCAQHVEHALAAR
jgi:hypothetical protein